MKEKLLNNLGLKIISLILAFIVWMAVVNISNPVITGGQDVTVEVMNAGVLEAANLTYEIVGGDLVNVRYRVRTRDQSLIRASDFHAYIDLNDYNVTGAVPVTIEVNKDKESMLIAGSVVAKPMVIRIVTEELQRKTFELETATKGTPEEGYALGAVTLVPGNVTVKGPISLIGQINHMGVEIDVDKANSDLEGDGIPIFYDANGNKLDLGEKVTVSSDTIHYTVSVLKAKNLTLNFEVKGDVAPGYRFTGVNCDVKSIPVIGTKSVLASITTLSVADDKLNITGAVANKEIHLDLSDYLPPNTAIAGDVEKSVTVTLKVEPLTTKSFSITLNELEKQESSPAYKYTYDKDKVDVVVKGLKEDLDTLDPKNLNVLLEVNGFGLGTHEGVLSFEVEEGFEVVSYSEFEVIVAPTGQAGPGANEGSTQPTTEAETTAPKKNTESQE